MGHSVNFSDCAPYFARHTFSRCIIYLGKVKPHFGEPPHTFHGYVPMLNFNDNVGPVSNRCSMPNPNDDDDSEDDCDVDIVMMMMSYPLMKLLANCLFGRLANKVRWFCWKSLFEICFNKRVSVFNSLYLHCLQSRCCSHKPHLTLRPATFRINYAHINACESQPPSSNLPFISLSGLGTCK